MKRFLVANFALAPEKLLALVDDHRSFGEQSDYRVDVAVRVALEVVPNRLRSRASREPARSAGSATSRTSPESA